MSEDRVLALLARARDAARRAGLARLAEHLDDGMLVAASEYAEASSVGGAAHERQDPAFAGGSA